MSANFGPTIFGKVALVACSASNEECQKNPPVIIGGKVEATAGIAASGFVGVEASSGEQCGRSCVGGKLNEIKLQASGSAEVEFLFKKFSYEDSVEIILHEGAGFGTAGCG